MSSYNILNMVDEDPRALLSLIKQMYKVFEFDPPNAKDYD